MKNTTLFLLLLSFCLKSFSSPADNVKEMAWFNELPPAMQYYLFERNQYRVVKKDDIRFLLPLSEIDLRLFQDVYDLSFLKDFTEIEKLYLPPSVNDFSALANFNFTNLILLDLSFTNIKESDLSNFKIKKIRKINLSGTSIEEFKFLEGLPNLNEIVILPNQLSRSTINGINSRYPNIRITYSESIRSFSNEMITQQVIDYIFFFDSTYGAFSELPKEFTIKMEINPEGRISKVDLISKKRDTSAIEELLSKIILAENTYNETKQLLIPVKKN